MSAKMVELRTKGEKGKVLTIPIVDFAEKVMYRPLPNKDNKHNKLDAKFYDGIYLGFNQRNSEYYICNEQGKIVGSRTIKRYTPESRWDYEFVNSIKGVPWDLEGQDVNIRLTPEFDEGAMQRIEAKVAPMQPPVRRFKISPKDFKTIGFTPGRPGCVALRQGTHNPGHEKQCR